MNRNLMKRCCVALSLAPFALPLNAVLAQEHAMTDLGPVSSVFDEVSINNKSEVAFTSDANHAVLYLPAPAHGLPAGLNDLGTLGGSLSHATDLNDSGKVVGYSYASCCNDHAFVWDNGVMTDLHYPGLQLQSYAMGINNRGEIVGNGYVDEGGPGPVVRALRWREGQYTNLGGVPNDNITYASYAEDINDAGDIVGWTQSILGKKGMFWFESTAMIPLPDDMGPVVQAFANNGSREIVGRSNLNANPGVFRPVSFQPVYDNNGLDHFDLVTLETNTSVSSEARAMNNLGHIVGTAKQSFGGVEHEVLWQNDTEIVLDTLVPEGSGWELFRVRDINNKGQMVGTGYLNGAAHAFLLSPIDQDEDGLFDAWETEGGGIDADGDGTIDLDLYARGARPDHKDLFVEVDAMSDFVPDAIPAIPEVVAAGLATGTSLDLAVKAYLDAPVNNPDGTQGIRLHIQLDETDLTTEPWPNGFAEFDAVKAAHYGTDAETGDPNADQLLAAKKMAYRYCIFAKTWGTRGSSGLAELPGDDFMVTLGHPGWVPSGGTPQQQGGTFMHEFGHTLGLHHGGQDDRNYKPNYRSVMNYTWQMPASWMAGSYVLTYSTHLLPMLNESFLIEPAGIGATGAEAGILTLHGIPYSPWKKLAYMGGPVDWNGDGDTGGIGIAGDITYMHFNGQSPSPNERLYGSLDWDHLLYAVRGGSNFSDGVHTSTTQDTEMTSQQFQELDAPIPGNCPADLNGDGVVDATDLATLLGGWGACAGCAGDINQDGVIDATDLATLLGGWGMCL